MNRRILLAGTLVLGALLLLLVGLSVRPEMRASAAGSAGSAGPAFTPVFSDVAPLMNATAAGYGTGVAWGDYDNDGYPDLYVVNLGPPPGTGQANVLLRNLGGAGFEDVTAAAGVGDTGPGVAAVWADVNNNGYLDLFVSNRPGANALFINQGDGSFVNMAAEAGVTDPAAGGEGSAWADLDRDGLVDLYVANYSSYGAQPNRLYHNLDGLHFVEIAAERGVAHMGNGEGVAWADFDRDGLIDLYVANTGPNVLYQQQPDGTFLDVTAAMNVPGGPGYSFGVCWGDYDNDGWLDLYVAQQGGNKLYRNLEGQGFADVTASAGVGGDRWSLGCSWADYDNDGWLDLHVANAAQAGYNPADVLYRNVGGVLFADVTAEAGVTNTLDARGSAWADLEGDGDLDLYVVNQGSGQPNCLFRNGGNANHWLQVRLVGRASNRAAIGAWVELTAEGNLQVREISGGSGFASQNGLPAAFGLGDWDGSVSLTVTWPSGVVQSLELDAVDQIITLVEPVPDLAGAAKGASTAAAMPLEPVTYTIALPNAGDWSAPARLTDTLPAELAWDGYLSATEGTAEWDPDGGQVRWWGAIEPGGAVTVTYRTRVGASVSPGTVVTNTAIIDDGYRPPFTTPPVTVTVLCRPLGDVDLDVTPAVPVAGQPVTLTAVVTGSVPIEVAWDLGDGTLKDGLVVIHTYASAGDYTVILTATNPCSQATAVHSLSVAPAVNRLYLPLLVRGGG
jgi:enediyne biosynthesis protein E4